MAFYPDPINSPAAQSTNYQLPNILNSPYSLLNILITMQYNTDIYILQKIPTLVNTLIYATKTLLVFTNYLLSAYNTYNPETTHLLPLPLYNPVTQ